MTVLNPHPDQEEKPTDPKLPRSRLPGSNVPERRLCTFTPALSRTSIAVLGEPSLVETLLLGHPGAELVVTNTRLRTINSGINEEDGRTKGRSIRISDAAIF